MTHPETTPATPEGDAISRARDAVLAGYDAWAAKPHNAKWVRKIDGTPIPNDLMVCIQSAVVAALRAQSAPVGGEVKG